MSIRKLLVLSLSLIALSSFAHAEEFDQLAKEIAGELVPPSDPVVSQSRNQRVLDDLNNTVVHERKDRISFVGPELRQSIFEAVLNHKVAGMDQLPAYDPSGALGLCWGRAMATHIESLRQGVNKEAIKKVWAVGNMDGPNYNWAYHVAIVLRGEDLRWYVLDPFFYRVMTVEEWYEILRDSNREKNINFYVTAASRYSRMTSAKYSKDVLLNDAYTHGFFTKLLESFRAQSQAAAKAKRTEVPN